MSAQVPTKIVLKSTTKMSLNDRFTSIQQHSRPQPTVQNIRSNMVAQQQASAANRRLAQQLANRPGLNMNMNQYPGGGGGGGGGSGAMGMDGMGMSAMNMNMHMPPPPQQQRSLKQRLGRGNIKARLNLDAVGRGAMSGGGSLRGRGAGQTVFNRGAPRGSFRGNRGQGLNTSQPMMRGRGGRGPMRGMNPGVRGQRGRGRGMMRGNFNRYPEDSSGWRGRGQGGRGQRPGGRYHGDRGRGGAPRGLSRGGGRGGFRGQGPMRGGRGRGGPRGRGRGGSGSGEGVSKEQLDNQLDEYMSKTKSYLDSELDTYMAEATP